MKKLNGELKYRLKCMRLMDYEGGNWIGSAGMECTFATAIGEVCMVYILTLALFRCLYIDVF